MTEQKKSRIILHRETNLEADETKLVDDIEKYGCHVIHVKPQQPIPGWSYTIGLYDGDGRRVSKVGSKLYWYGSGGEILAETDASGNNPTEYIFFGGQRVAMLPAGSTPIYYVEDLLGTSRVTTTNTGVVCYDADFYPFGVERTPYINTCTQNNYKFEGKERDTETGNDDFGARYYSNLTVAV